MAASDHKAVLGIIAEKSTSPLKFPAKGTALIVVELQRAFVQPDGRFPALMSVLAPGAIQQYRDRIATTVVPNAKHLITAFRQAGFPSRLPG